MKANPVALTEAASAKRVASRRTEVGAVSDFAVAGYVNSGQPSRKNKRAVHGCRHPAELSGRPRSLDASATPSRNPGHALRSRRNFTSVARCLGRGCRRFRPADRLRMTSWPKRKGRRIGPASSNRRARACALIARHVALVGLQAKAALDHTRSRLKVSSLPGRRRSSGVFVTAVAVVACPAESLCRECP